VGLVHEQNMQAKHMHTRERLDDNAGNNANYVYVVGARATTSNLYTHCVLNNERLAQAHAVPRGHHE
jgi:hypothetical protein